jgi:hypothetical protein
MLLTLVRQTITMLSSVRLKQIGMRRMPFAAKRAEELLEKGG